ncbi:palmitoyltransferas-like protein PFA3 [Dothidotthia symphoricarpi CBS 119687]|uniref:Palmitoyltransferase n=1 Tax=Dothidotthia symphoricarpi CBS 119687 TaxID=1392245 RepID=A0A6A6A4D4_9PLEO|nr:palmitoyltransferas-like protein PFA3 [Dothidotthia symphoricarpi CBS 119687]KAF2126862.1 palmitoyltransferas-like protein PFA3 [Dothidotthia symphoricarpi CBS 119687]
MATLGSPSPPSSPSRTMRRRGWARKVERYCCTAVTYFPLLFVYGLTSWAVWVEAGIGFVPSTNVWTGKLSSALGVFLYFMLNWSYTAAVFTDPGSPLNLNNGYSHLPTQEGGDIQYTSFTVKASTGDVRFCNKCQSKKPDRAHHCSTCRRCVLKMDHHCPWLATCVGLRNYKMFILFLTYLTFFCWTCFATSATWVYSEILSDGQYTESFMPVNYVLLAVLSGIIGIVITGFTAWHLWLSVRGQTTIESLEKTRYLSPLRNTIKHNHNDRNYLDAQANGRLSISDQLREIHANALPGVTRPEEGESTLRSPAPGNAAMGNGYSHPAYQSYEERERQQSHNRYEDYLDERDNELLPNAFDLGWKRNLGHVFGPSPLTWFVPICNTTGDGWSWEPSPKWLAARERIKREREAEEQQQKQRERAAGWGLDSPTEAEFRRNSKPTEGWQPQRHNGASPRHPHRPEWQSPLRRGEQGRYLTTSNGIVNAPKEGRRSPCKADQILGRGSDMYTDGDVPLQTLDNKKKFDQYNYISEDDDDDEYELSSDEQAADQRKSHRAKTVQAPMQNWNDIPEGFLDPAPRGKKSVSRDRNAGPRKTQEWDDWKS